MDDFGDNEGCLYQKERVGSMSSVFMSRSLDEVDHCDIPCPPGTFFDDNFTSLKHFTMETDYTEVTGLTLPVNAWAFSSNEQWSDDMISKMGKLTQIDMSDTVDFPHRPDLRLSVKAVMMATLDKNIEYLDLSNNYLDQDGGSTFVKFLEKNPHLKVFKINKCGLGLKTTELIAGALNKNPNLKLIEFQAAKNDFCADSMI